MLRFTLKIILASLLTANIALADKLFVGGSFGMVNNKFNTDEKNSDSFNSVASDFIGIESGIIFNMNEVLSIGVDIFVEPGSAKLVKEQHDVNISQANNLATIFTTRNISSEIKKTPAFIGLKTRAIYHVSPHSNLYGTLGIGATRYKKETSSVITVTSYDHGSLLNEEKISVTSAAKIIPMLRMGVGMDYMLSDTLSAFVEFNNDSGLDKFEEYQVLNTSMKVGIRYFF